MSGDIVRSEARAQYDAELSQDVMAWRVRFNQRVLGMAKAATETAVFLVQMRDAMSEAEFEWVVDSVCEEHDIQTESFLKYERVLRASIVGNYRFPQLSYSHHDAVYYISLTDIERRNILMEAMEKRLSVRATRALALERANIKESVVHHPEQSMSGDAPLSRKQAVAHLIADYRKLVGDSITIIEGLDSGSDEEVADYLKRARALA